MQTTEKHPPAEPNELQARALEFAKNSKRIGITAHMIVTCAENDTECQFPVCMLYGGEVRMVTTRDVAIPLTPMPIPWTVGAWLISEYYVTGGTETTRDGIRTRWYTVTMGELT
jgi:hypothetical protein